MTIAFLRGKISARILPSLALLLALSLPLTGCGDENDRAAG